MFFTKYHVLSLRDAKERPIAMLPKEKRTGYALIYARCAPNNVVRFRGSLMAAADALITTKYGPISPPGAVGIGSFAISNQPAYCRRGTRPYAPRFFHQPTYPFCRISTTSWAPPWRWPMGLRIEREIRFPNTTKFDRTRISDDSLSQGACNRKNIDSLFHFSIYTVGKMR